MESCATLCLFRNIPYPATNPFHWLNSIRTKKRESKRTSTAKKRLATFENKKKCETKIPNWKINWFWWRNCAIFLSDVEEHICTVEVCEWRTAKNMEKGGGGLNRDFRRYWNELDARRSEVFVQCRRDQRLSLSTGIRFFSPLTSIDTLGFASEFWNDCFSDGYDVHKISQAIRGKSKP